MKIRQGLLFRHAGLPSLIFLLSTLLGCGGTARQLQSITVSPASANAQNFANKQVQFTATGQFNTDPMTAMPQVLWSIGSPFAKAPVPAGVSIDQNGLAQCTTFMGIVTIQATSPMDPNMPLSQMGMTTSNVAGTAQLTCP